METKQYELIKTKGKTIFHDVLSGEKDSEIIYIELENGFRDLDITFNDDTNRLIISDSENVISKHTRKNVLGFSIIQDPKKIIMNANLTFSEIVSIFAQWLEKYGLTSLADLMNEKEYALDINNNYLQNNSTGGNTFQFNFSSATTITGETDTTLTSTISPTNQKDNFVEHLKELTKKTSKANLCCRINEELEMPDVC